MRLQSNAVRQEGAAYRKVLVRCHKVRPIVPNRHWLTRFHRSRFGDVRNARARRSGAVRRSTRDVGDRLQQSTRPRPSDARRRLVPERCDQRRRIRALRTSRSYRRRGDHRRNGWSAWWDARTASGLRRATRAADHIGFRNDGSKRERRTRRPEYSHDVELAPSVSRSMSAIEARKRFAMPSSAWDSLLRNESLRRCTLARAERSRRPRNSRRSCCSWPHADPTLTAPNACARAGPSCSSPSDRFGLLSRVEGVDLRKRCVESRVLLAKTQWPFEEHLRSHCEELRFVRCRVLAQE